MRFLRNAMLVLCILMSFNCRLAQSEEAEEQASVKITIADVEGKPVANGLAYWFRNGKAKKLRISEDSQVSVAAATGLVVVQSPDHQCSGVVLQNKTRDELENAAIVLRSHNQPGRPLKTLPVPVRADQRKEIVAETLDLYWTKLKANPKDQNNVISCGRFLSSMDPKGLNALLDAGNFGFQIRGMLKRLIVMATAKENPEFAIEVCDSMKQPIGRVSLLAALLERLTENSPYVEAVEEQLIETIKATSQPAFRYAVWAGLGEYYVHSDQRELADKIVEEHLAEVKKLPSGGWAAFPKSLFAALLIEKDPDLAVELISGCKDYERTRALGRLAFHCCLTNPELAMQLLEKIEHAQNTINTAENRIKVAYRMTGPQTEWAFQVAESIEETNQQAWAWGMIASKLIGTDPDLSKKALQNAIDALMSTDAKAKASNYFSMPKTMAGLIPIAEKVAPEKMEQMVWQSVWLAIPKSRWNLGGQSKKAKRQTAVAALSRYDRNIASALLGDQEIEIGWDASKSAVAQVVIDFEGVAAFIDRMNTPQDASKASEARVAVAKLLAKSDEEFWDAVSLPNMLHWPTKTFESD